MQLHTISGPMVPQTSFNSLYMNYNLFLLFKFIFILAISFVVLYIAYKILVWCVDEYHEYKQTIADIKDSVDKIKDSLGIQDEVSTCDTQLESTLTTLVSEEANDLDDTVLPTRAAYKKKKFKKKMKKK